MKTKYNNIEISLSKRLTAVFMLVTYITVSSPVTLIAGEMNINQKNNDYIEEISEKLITSKDGGTIKLGNAMIEIPEGAVKKDTKISISRLSKVSDTGDSLFNAIPKSGGYRFLPAGTQFEKEVTVTLPYSKELNSKPQALEDLYTYFYDTKKKQWVKLERLEVDKEKCLVHSLTTHFTDMINATLTLPESASPVDVNLNSIKNLEAAKPDGHLIKFNQPQASNTGDATFSFELGIPSGRRGMQPQVSVSYSSAGGNGIMGKGFDVNYGSVITTDTRFGLPEYNTQDTYMLDGILLEEKSRSGTNITYTPKKETSFSRIVRIGAGTDNDYWEVTDKSGTKRFFGTKGEACVGSGKNKYSWYLTKTQDVFGNCIDYDYVKEEHNVDGYVYPSEISYTGKNDAKGNYHVKFNYDENNIIREDVRIDARSKKLVYCKKLLTSITTHYKDNTALRTYSFKYKDGLAKEKMLTSLKITNNADGIYEYSFDYVEPKKDSDGNTIYFNEAVEWTNGQPIQTGNSTSVGANFSTGTAGGYGLRVADVRTGGSVSGSVTNGDSYTEDSLIDINGDGRIDAVGQSGDEIFVYINNGNGFDSKQSIKINSGSFNSDIDHEETSSSSFGWNVYGGAGLKSNKVSVSLGGGYSEVYQKSSSTAKCTFIDLDRDGLVDIVEAGKNTYLKNNGNLTFDETPIYSEVKIDEIKQTISPTDAEEYRKTYLVQTPFRMWKAPYDGVISMRQNAKPAHESYNPHVNTVIKTYIGNGNSEPSLEREIKKNLTVNASKENFNVTKDKTFYFISDNGIEPIDSDIEWNIEFEYSKIRAFKNNYTYPVFNQKKFIESKTFSYSKPEQSNFTFNTSKFKSDSIEKAEKEFTTEILESPLYFVMYNQTATVSHDGENKKYNCDVKFTYNPKWLSKVTEYEYEALYEAFIKTGYVYPTVFTEEEFDQYLDYIGKYGNPPEDGKIDEKYYSVFAGQFTRSVTENLYLLKEFKATEKMTYEEAVNDFFSKYPLNPEIAISALKNYQKQGYQLEARKDGSSYSFRKTQTPPDMIRSKTAVGSMYIEETNSHKYIILSEYLGRKIAYDTVDQKLLFSDIEGYSEVNFSYDVISSTDNEVTIGLEKDENNVYESTISFNLQDISYKVENLTENEMQEIIDKTEVPYINVHDKHWNLTESNFVKENEINNLFADTTLTKEEQKQIINSLYQLKERYKTEKNKETGEEITTLDYLYYVLKEDADFESVQALLLEYKQRKVLTELFPYYKHDGNEYILNPLEVTNDDKESHLSSVCKKHGYGKLCSIEIYQKFEEERLYNVKDDNIPKYITVDDNGALYKKELIVPKLYWNSREDFSSYSDIENADVTFSKTVYEYEETGNDEKTKDYKASVQVTVNNDEFLYGGRNNWFYGIWKGALNDAPFSEQKLRNFKKEISEDDYNKKRSEANNTNANLKNSASVSKSTADDNMPFYSPRTGHNAAKEYEETELKNASIKYIVNLENALCGTISVYSDVVKKNGSKQLKNSYYMPFISTDIIHSDRAGGVSYYNIEGLYEPKTQTSATGTAFIMPSIRKTYTDGTDRTPNINAGLGGKTKKSLADAAKDDTIEGFFSIGGSKGRNESTSNVEQTLMDINGNGIPDIIQKTGGSFSVTEGIIDEATGCVKYNKTEKFSGAGVISRNKTDVDVVGGSVGAGGNVCVTPKGKNASKSETKINASSSASGGITASSGTSVQEIGLLDLNGDGLLDYFDGDFLKINNGSSFIKIEEIFKGLSSITESKNESKATNFTVNFGASTPEVNSMATGASVSLGGSYSSSYSITEKIMLDINGDGLQDILSMKSGSQTISVLYNTGNGFVKENDIFIPDWNEIVVNKKREFKKFADSDGFDLVLMGDVPIIGSMLGSGIAYIAENPYGSKADEFTNSLEWNSSVTIGLSGSIGMNVNYGIDIIVPTPVPVYCGTINMTFNGGEGMNASSTVNGVSVRMADLDGDGLADHVMRIPGDSTWWKRNISGRYGQLTKINLPQGGNVSIEYKEKYGTTENPNFKYVMSKLTVSDGTGSVLPEVSDGEHSVTTTFTYDKGYYDRYEKENYGFETVTTTFADGTYKKDTYYVIRKSVEKYYAKGQLKESCMYSSDNKLLSQTKTTLCTSPLALPEKEESWTYEESSPNASIYTFTEYEYDFYGNCTKVTQNYGDGVTLTGEITYNNENTTDYIIGLPVSISVRDNEGLRRYRTGTYNAKGQLIELQQYYDENNLNLYAENKLTYDSYGNISSVTDSRGAKLSYKYDEVENMFVKEVKQSGNKTDTYISSLEYDIPTQTKKLEKDCNNNEITYDYDHWQRITRISTSYDKGGSTPAVSYEYHTPGKNSDGKHELWYAITNNKVTFDKEDDSVIQTVLQIDGVGRAVRTAKTGFVEGVEGWNASGAVEYDNKGRTVKEGMTEFIEGTLEDLLNSKPEMTSLYTSYKYDQKDRKIKTVLPDKSEQTNAFYIEENRQVSEAKDPNGNVSIQETDSRGNIVRVAKEDSSNHQLTEVTYEYNAMGEMLKAFDAKKHPVSVEYDLLGRKTALESLDSGRQEFFYDKSSNLVKETNSVLREHNKQILYEYDGLNRLVKVNYPDTKDTVYTYGGAGAANGAAGKILKTEDASGTLEYEYGSLGEVTKETRTLKTYLGSGGTKDAVMEYRSDYLGRMQWILYPDGEKVTYGYDRGGQVVSVTGKYESRNEEFNYVTNILYDQYGQRTRIDYGNGTFTEYKYDPARRWLDTIKTQNKWGQSYQNISYSFDRVGNVSFYENNCLDNVNGNYKTRQEYSYDSLYQLTKAHGFTSYNPYSSSVPEFESEYTQEFEFDADGLGNMMSKISTETVTPQKTIGDNLNYSFNYVYDKNYAHRLLSAGDRYYQYDSNGNVTCEQDGSFDEEDVEYHRATEEADGVYSSDYAWAYFKDSKKKGSESTRYHRTYTWDEKNRLINSTDSSYNTSYVYGQDGQRSNKYTQSSETLYFNKMWTFHTDSGNSVYGGQTAKNIYLGETRIVTKLNSGTTPTYQEEFYKQYYYHSDHLGSASLISDYKGDEYQRIEYTPYGETWVEKTDNTGLEFLPYKFTAKEQDEETGLYYYGARYLDSRYSRWISTDPALGDYIPQAPINDEAKKNNQNLPGMGGIFNHINSNLFAYAANNPVKYTDPDGRAVNIENLGNNITRLPNLYQKEFKQKIFTASTPLNQMDLDKALGIDSNPSTTKSCQTTAMINAYAANNSEGITGEQILQALTIDGGATINDSLLNTDGSPSDTLSAVSKSLAKSCGLDSYLEPNKSGKIKPSLLANLKNGAILGYSLKSSNKDSHFGFINWNTKIDSLDKNRSSASKYKENSFWILKWRKIDE